MKGKKMMFTKKVFIIITAPLYQETVLDNLSTVIFTPNLVRSQLFLDFSTDR